MHGFILCWLFGHKSNFLRAEYSDKYFQVCTRCGWKKRVSLD
jgi:hypothetical protein